MDNLDFFLDLDNYNYENLVTITGCSYFDNNIIFNKLLNYSNFNTCNALFLPNIKLYYNSGNYNIVNLPSTDSLLNTSPNKVITRDFICFANPKCIIVTSNEDNLEKNLKLLFQIMEINKKIILCINSLSSNNEPILDIDLLQSELGIPVLLCKQNKFEIELLLKLLDDIIFNEYIYNAKYSLYDCNIESVINSFNPLLQQSISNIDSRWLALRIIDDDQSFFKSMSAYLDESCITKINTIKDSFPKTLDPIRVRYNLNKRTYDYSVSLRNKVYFPKTNTSFSTSKNFSKYTFFFIIIFILLLLWFFMIFNF